MTTFIFNVRHLGLVSCLPVTPNSRIRLHAALAPKKDRYFYVFPTHFEDAALFVPLVT